MEIIRDIEEANRCIRELVAISLLPSIWSGGQAEQIRDNLADGLASSLRAEVVSVRCGEGVALAAETPVCRVKEFQDRRAVVEALTQAMETVASSGTDELVEMCLEGRRLKVAISQLGVHHEFGVIAVGSTRENFPTAAERILLNVAVNQAGIAFRSAKQLATLKRSESDLRDFFENATLGLHWVDENGIIIWANRTELEMLGYSKEEYVGRSITEFHADGCVIEDILGRLKRGETLREYEAKLRCKDGSIRTVLIDSSVLFEKGKFIHTRCFTRDITARKAAEQAAAEASEQREKELRALADSIPQLAWIANPDGARFWFNRRWFEYTGTTLEQVQGWGWQSVHDPQILPQVMENWRASIAMGKPFQADFPLRAADGTYRWFLTQVNPVRDADNRVVRWFGTNTDVDEVKRAQDALKQAQAELRQHADKLEEEVTERTARLRETIQELEAFSYSISHDMRAPLRAMQGYADALLDEYEGKLGQTGRDYLLRIRRSAKRMDLLIQDVLAYSRVAKGEIDLKRIEVEGVIRDVIQNYPALQSERCDIVVACAIPPVCGHEAYLTQIISNLLTNAAKFVAPGVRPKITIRASKEGAMVRIVVEDNGIGIAPHNQTEIFKIFGRVYSEKQYEGTGIGLAIAKKAAERMGGSIQLESELGRGSKFIVLLREAP